MHAVIAICLGACAGALLRWQFGLWFNHAGAWMPWGTLAANLVGGYLVGVVIGALHQLPQVDPAWRLLLITGFLGALTTFSSFSAEVLDMLLHERWLQAVGTTTIHLVGSLLLTWLGLHSATWLIATRA